MARTPRIKIGDQDTFYHITARVVGTPDWFPFADSAARNKLLSLIRKYTRAYFCRVASFSLMSNHYHLLVGFEAARTLSRQELRERAGFLYPDLEKVLKNDQQWERFSRRLFDLSELMRNIQSAFTKWYNRSNGRRGSLWDGRFRSTIPLDQQAVQETLAYIELNPVRAGLVSRPEDYMSSSAFLRHIGADDWLMPIGELFEGSDQMQSYRGFLYYRGFEGGSKEGARIPAEILRREQQRGFNRQGIYRKRLRYFAEGLVLGSEEKVRDWISLFDVVVDIYGGAIRSRTWMALLSRFASSVLSRKLHPTDPLEAARDDVNFKRWRNPLPLSSPDAFCLDRCVTRLQASLIIIRSEDLVVGC